LTHWLGEARSAAGRFLLDNPLDAITLRRYATHAGVILLIVAAFWLSQIRLPEAAASSSLYSFTPAETQSVSVAEEPLPLPLPVSFLALTRSPVPRTTILERARQEPVTYNVQSGDSLYGIAQKFGISGDTLVWANQQEDSPDVLRIGQELIVPPVSGVYLTVKKGDTLQNIAARYQVKPEAITGYPGNHLKPPFTLTAGDKLMLPGGQKPYVARVVHAYAGPIPKDATQGSGIFGWPTSGMLTQKYWGGHPAIDIGGAIGVPVYAADSGYVALVGWSNVGYGNMLLIDHGNGFQTLYAHLQRSLVREGQSVVKGQKIALMGCTGRCTGPHLHFEIRKVGVQRNPIGILP